MNYEQLKNSILQEAIEGRLVPQDPNDEPASVLLDRIAAEKAELVKAKKIKKDKNESRIYRTEDGHWMERFSDKKRPEVCIDEEIPFDIPESWEWCRVQNLFELSSGKQQSSNNKGKGTPQKFITTSNLYWGYFILDKMKVMNFSDVEIKTCSATNGDLLVCEGGAGYGRSAIWNYDYDICLQNHIHRLRPYIKGIIAKYVFYLLYFLKGTNKLTSVGTAMPGLSANRLKTIFVPLPPLKEQERIVSKIEQVLPKVEEYGAAQDKLDALNAALPEKLKNSVLQEAIEGRLVPQNDADEPASALLDRIHEEKEALIKEKVIKRDKNESRIYRTDDGHWMERFYDKKRPDVCIDDEIPFDIPESWEWCRLGFVVNFSKSNSVKPNQINENDWILDLEDIEKGTGKVIQKKLMKDISSKSDKHFFKKGNVLYSKLRPYLNKVVIADEDGYCTSEILAFDFREINNKYAQIYLMSNFFVSYAMAGAYGVKMPRLGSERGNNALFPIPPIQEQARIVAKLNDILPRINNLGKI